jgi:hypothetical protein
MPCECHFLFSICDHLICILFVSRSLNVAMGRKVQGSNPGVGENLRTHPARPLIPPSLLYNGLCVIPWNYIGRIVTLTTHPHLTPKLKKGYALHQFPSGPSWPVLGKHRLLRMLFTSTNVVMWEYVLISIILDVTEFTTPHHYLCCILQVWIYFPVLHFVLKFQPYFHVSLKEMSEWHLQFRLKTVL